MAAREVLAFAAAQEHLTAMKILFATSEFADFTKSGGLGEVAAGLPAPLGDHHATPAYRRRMIEVLLRRSLSA